MKNKKAMDFLMEHVIFIVLVLIFFTAMFLFIYRTGARASFIEENYAKQISLIIDKSKPGTKVDLDVFKLYQGASKNNFNLIININNDEKYVEIKLAPGKGYRQSFFSVNNVIWSLDKENEKLHLEVK